MSSALNTSAKWPKPTSQQPKLSKKARKLIASAKDNNVEPEVNTDLANKAPAEEKAPKKVDPKELLSQIDVDLIGSFSKDKPSRIAQCTYGMNNKAYKKEDLIFKIIWELRADGVQPEASYVKY